jgi:hypothetical protein
MIRRSIAACILVAASITVAHARFLQTDPVGYKDDVDLYTYVGNDPTDLTDPTGKDHVFCFPSGGKIHCQESSDGGKGTTFTYFNASKGLFESTTINGRLGAPGVDKVLNSSISDAFGVQVVTRVPVGRGSLAGATGFDRHHSIPSQILKQLNPAVRNAVQGKKGDPNRVPILQRDHWQLHDAGYNRRWEQELFNRGGARAVTEQDVRDIDGEIRDEYGLPPR